MIEIHIPNRENLQNKHLSAIRSISLSRIEFCETLFNVALRRMSIDRAISKIEKHFGISALTANSIVKDFVSSRRKKTVNNQTILGFLKGQDQSLLSKSSRRYEFLAYLDSLDFIRSNFDMIILGNPEVLIDLNRKFKKSYNQKFTKEVGNLLHKIFPYDKLKDGIFITNLGEVWNNFTLTQELNLQVCPYCNRSWINTVVEGKRKIKVVNPQLDHFFSQKDYPLLLLSLYNLIPSCDNCNTRLKHEVEFDMSYLHPYLEGYESNVKFGSIAVDYNSSIGLGASFKVYIYVCNSDAGAIKRIRKNHDLFEIDSIYESHGQIIAEIYRKSFISQNKYLEILKNQFPSANNGFAELYRMALGNFYNEEDFSKRPFSKLTKEIAEQVGLI